ncbi:MAG TPA: TetR/AcrR family transcriptional regulator, partial [Terriglobales bacterium]|nr:TetR/AcrR family transcriptional regulator [Terriglobales bacterium]
FKRVLDDLDDPRNPRDCLLARSVSSDVLAERDLQKFVQTDIAAFVGAVSDRLKSAKETGELPPQFEAEVVAQVIATYLQGLIRTALLSYDRSQLERQVDQFFTSLGL